MSLDTYCAECAQNTSGKCWQHSNIVYTLGPVVETKPHKCPVCNGTGKVSRPPWVAGDVEMWTDSQTGPYACQPCDGKGIIWG